MIEYEKDEGELAQKFKGKRHLISQMIEEEQQTIEGREYI